MKATALLSPLLFTALATSQLLPAFLRPGTINPARHLQKTHKQHPIMDTPNIALPPPDKENPTPPSDPYSLILSDVLPKTRSINIFAGFTRDIEDISNRLDDKAVNTTLLCPLNSAVQALPRKPWEDPRQEAEMGEKAYEGKEGEDRATANLRRFVEAHVVGGSPWKEGVRRKSLLGGEIWWEEKGGVRKVC
jgi:hypothetical protein